MRDSGGFEHSTLLFPLLLQNKIEWSLEQQTTSSGKAMIDDATVCS